MVNLLNSGLGSLGLSPGQGHCIVLLGKTLYSYSASRCQGVEMDTGKSNVAGNPTVD